MSNFKVDVCRQTGTTTLWMAANTPCGFRMVLGWPDIDGMKEFAEMLLDIYYQQREQAGPGLGGRGKISMN